MGLLERFRRGAAQRQAQREQAEYEARGNHCTESFRQILSAAKALRYHHSINRTHGHFDDMIG